MAAKNTRMLLSLLLIVDFLMFFSSEDARFLLKGLLKLWLQAEQNILNDLFELNGTLKH